jgi:hypothetical protein
LQRATAPPSEPRASPANAPVLRNTARLPVGMNQAVSLPLDTQKMAAVANNNAVSGCESHEVRL